MPVASTAPARLDLWVYAGDENRIELEVLSGNVPVDLTGATIEAQARVAAASSTIAMSAAISEIDYTAGQVAMAWDGNTVRTLLGPAELWEGVWDLQIKLAGRALPTTPLKGKFTAEHDVTRAGA